MSDFPTLSSFKLTEEVYDSWEIGYVNDPTIRSDQEAGYEVTRSRFTRDRRTWSYEYPYYTLADKTILEAFQVSMRFGANSFNWTNPIGGNTFVVRFAEPIVFKPMKGTSYWKIKIKVAQV